MAARKPRPARERGKLHPDRPGKKIGYQEQFRLLVDGARGYAMFLLDEDNKVTFWNKGAEAIFGWTCDEALGKPGTMIFTPEDKKRKADKAEFDEARREGCAQDKRWHLRKDRSRVWADGMLMALKDPDTGETRGFAKVCRDATDEYKTQEDLRKSYDEMEQRVFYRTAELQAMNESLEQEMAQRQQLEREILAVTERERARISQDLHDSLCQELTATAFLLKSQAQALAKTTPKCAEALAEAAKLVNDNAGAARDLARGLHPFDVGAASLPRALRELASRTNEKIPCRCECARSVRIGDASISANLYRIAQEAVHNAVRHSRANEIVIACQRADDDVVISVRDDGIGMKPRKRPHGLGLRMMNYRADVSGGTLDVKSVRGRGTTLTCRIPLSR